MSKTTTVSAYIAAAPPQVRSMLKQIRAAIRSAAPQAQEMISYTIPFYQYRSLGYKGRMAYFAGYPNFVSMYVVPRTVPTVLARQVAKYKTSKSTLKFPLGTKIPVTLIQRLVKIRMKEIDQSLDIGEKAKRR